MIDDKTWQHVEKTLTVIKQENHRATQIVDMLKLDMSSPLCEPFYLLMDSSIDTLAKLVGDDDDIINFWVFDCNFGTTPTVCSSAPHLGEIKTLSFLRQAIEAQEK